MVRLVEIRGATQPRLWLVNTGLLLIVGDATIYFIVNLLGRAWIYGH